jgi:ankyrin repeat protein
MKVAKMVVIFLLPLACAVSQAMYIPEPVNKYGVLFNLLNHNLDLTDTDKAAITEIFLKPEYNVAVNEQGQNGNTLLHRAVERANSIKTIKTLLDARADPSIKGKFGWTALEYAEKLQNAENIKALQGYK